MEKIKNDPLGLVIAVYWLMCIIVACILDDIIGIKVLAKIVNAIWISVLVLCILNPKVMRKFKLAMGAITMFFCKKAIRKRMGDNGYYENDIFLN